MGGVECVLVWGGVRLGVGGVRLGVGCIPDIEANVPSSMTALHLDSIAALSAEGIKSHGLGGW